MARYEMRPPQAAHGRSAAAWDTLLLRPAALRILPEGLTAQGAGAQLLTFWEKWHEAEHPGLLRPLVLDFQERLLVREWATGPSLLELLRQRRRLEGNEALALLQSAAPLLDWAEPRRLLTDTALDKWFVALEAGAAEGLTAGPLAGWPAWQIRLDPLRLATLLPQQEDRTAHFLAPPPPGVPLAVHLAARFVRELLGGSAQRAGAPLSSLPDEGNRVLASALQPAAFASATALAAALAATLAEPIRVRAAAAQRPRREYRLTRSLDRESGAIDRLLLEPESPRAKAVQLICRSELRLGRSSLEADLALRFADATPVGEGMTKGLSRVHARLQEKQGRLRLLDGSAAGPSQNGTFTREGQLTAPEGRPLERLALIQFGAHWRGTLAPVPIPEQVILRGEEEASAAEEAGGSGGWGAVFILPARGCSARTETVWLRQEAGFGLSPEGTLTWDITGPDSAPAAFLLMKGRPWLLNRRLEQPEILLDQLPLAPGSAAPLRDGTHLLAGRTAWRIRF